MWMEDILKVTEAEWKGKCPDCGAPIVIKEIDQVRVASRFRRKYTLRITNREIGSSHICNTYILHIIYICDAHQHLDLFNKHLRIIKWHHKIMCLTKIISQEQLALYSPLLLLLKL